MRTLEMLGRPGNIRSKKIQGRRETQRERKWSCPILVSQKSREEGAKGLLFKPRRAKARTALPMGEEGAGLCQVTWNVHVISKLS